MICLEDLLKILKKLKAFIIRFILKALVIVIALIIFGIIYKSSMQNVVDVFNDYASTVVTSQ